MIGTMKKQNSSGARTCEYGNWRVVSASDIPGNWPIEALPLLRIWQGVPTLIVRPGELAESQMKFPCGLKVTA